MREGMRFYVTRASVTHLGAWLAAEWIPSRIVETHLTFAAAGAAAARLNRRAAGGEAGQSIFYFVSTDAVSTAGHGGDSAQAEPT